MQIASVFSFSPFRLVVRGFSREAPVSIRDVFRAAAFSGLRDHEYEHSSPSKV